MSRTITVTGGYSGALVVDVADGLKQLGDASFRLALTPVGQDDPPPFDSPSWLTTTSEGTSSAAVVSASVNGTMPVGYYNLALDVVSAGTHQAEWVLETRTKRRALVVIT